MLHRKLLRQLTIIAYLYLSAARGQAEWRAVMDGGFGSRFNWEVASLVEFNGYLYAGTTNTNASFASDGTEIWRTADGENWERTVVSGAGNVHNYSTYPLMVFQGNLYGSLFNPDDGGVIIRTADGNDWQEVVSGGFDSVANAHAHSLCIYRGALYAGTVNVITGAQLWRTADGTAWEPVQQNGFGDGRNVSIPALAVHQDYLYATTWNFAGAQIWRGDAAGNWERVLANGLNDPGNISGSTMVSNGSRVFAGLSFSTLGAQVVSSEDGITWTVSAGPGFWNYRNEGIFKLHLASDNSLYAATYNLIEGLEIWSMPHSAGHWFLLGQHGCVSPANFESYCAADFNAATYFGTANTDVGASILRWRGASGIQLHFETTAQIVSSGDQFTVTVRGRNDGPAAAGQLAILLDLGPGFEPQYYFAPSWTSELETIAVSFAAGEQFVQPVFDFTVPEMSAAGPFYLHTAVVDNGLTQLISGLRTLEFKFSGGM